MLSTTVEFQNVEVHIHVQRLRLLGLHYEGRCMELPGMIESSQLSQSFS